MRILDVEYPDKGKATLTLEMTVQEVEAFQQALAAGKLDGMGIIAESVADLGPGDGQKTKWTASEDAKRWNPKDGPDPTRRP